MPGPIRRLIRVPGRLAVLLAAGAAGAGGAGIAGAADSPVRTGSAAMTLLPALPEGRLVALSPTRFVHVGGDRKQGLIFIGKTGKITKTVPVPKLAEKAAVSAAAAAPGGMIVAGGHAAGSGAGPGGGRPCPWLAQIGHDGAVAWQICLVGRFAAMVRGDVEWLRVGANGRIYVHGRTLLRTAGDSRRFRRFHAVVAAGRVIRLTYADDEFKGMALRTRLFLRAENDGGAQYVYLFQTEREARILLVRRDRDGRLAGRLPMVTARRGPGIGATLFLKAAAPAAGGDLFVFFHGYYRRVLQQRYARFLPTGFEVWHRGWTFRDIQARRGGFGVDAAVVRANGEVLAIGEKSLTRISPDGDIIETVDIREGGRNHRIRHVLRAPGGAVLLQGRFFRADGSGGRWVVRLGDWPR